MVENLMEKIVSLCKRRGFVFPGSEIYGGFSGFWDYGPLGVELKNNIRNLWWQRFVHDREDIYGLDTAITMNPKVWEASGHTGAGFTDPILECTKCGELHRGDQSGIQDFNNINNLDNVLTRCTKCGAKGAGILNKPRQFNLMFKTQVGPYEDVSAEAYFRPETAQGIFTNFKNVVDALHPKIPFGIAQVGKAFRNEISPRDFTFRSREFEQMEIEYFIKENEWEKHFENWRNEMQSWMRDIGILESSITELDVPKEDLAHYSKKTIDFEFEFPFGVKELYGLAYRTDFDLKNHSEHSGVSLVYSDTESNERFTPHVIEPTFGLDRSVLAVLISAYFEDEINGEQRILLKLPPTLAPVKVAVFPLLRNKPQLVEKARSVYENLKLNPKSHTQTPVIFDDNGNIGKRYRRQDEIGTPYCVTIDFDTLEDDTVTVRERDSGQQTRVNSTELGDYLSEKLF